MAEIEILSPPAPVSMADEWFDLATPHHFWVLWRHSILLRELRRAHFRGDNALDVGCGHGVVRKMVERDLGIRVDGCDLNQGAIEKAGGGKGRLLVYNIFDRKPEMLGFYDLILLMDVLEHIDDDLEFFRIALQHLKPGGFVAINVPAHITLYSRYDQVAGHKRRYSVGQIKSLLSQAGLASRRVVQWGFLLLPTLLIRQIILNITPAEHTIRRGFVPANRFVEKTLNIARSIETSLPFSPPLGSSILAVGQLPFRRSHQNG